jgi:hypothetical protein
MTFFLGDDDDDRFPVPDSVHNYHDSDVRNLDSGPMNRSTQNLMNHDQVTNHPQMVFRATLY